MNTADHIDAFLAEARAAGRRPKTVFVRAAVYESDPLITFVHRAYEGDEYYELPAAMVEAYETADKARAEAVAAIEAHIRDRHLQRHDDW